ncbi:MAG: DNA polymerase III subunit gamma/tau [Elusimicrobia bacterium]|nr:DNA polymerase III subunit gamma/tau [Elusimicrobiota bacterium]
MSYLVLARKYRPQGFDDLVGQEHVTQTLTNALAARRIAHAYVLSGPRGCGKTTTARILAKALNCVKGPTPTPCGECPQCVEITAGSSTDDVLEIDGASNRGIDQIRELRETVKYAPARSRYRVIIIDEAHQISKDGFNALLKTLEEPPPHVVFIMATTESQKIPETILSRCQRFQLRSITLGDIFSRLKKIIDAESLPVDKAALREVGRAAHGSLRDALSLLDQVIAFAPGGATVEDVRNLLGLLPGEFIRSFAETIRSGDPAAVLQAVQKALDDGLDLSQLAEDLLERRHRLLLWKAGVRDPRAPDAAELESEAGALGEERLERDLGILSRAVADMRRSESPRITFELACLEIAQDAVSVNELVERLETLEKNLRSGMPPPSISAPAPRPPMPERTVAPPAVGQTPGTGRPSEPPRPPEPVSAPTAPVASGPWGPDMVRSAWTAMVQEVGKKKPSLETFLHAARWSALPGNVLKLAFDQEFQKFQVASQEALWMEILRRHIPLPFSLQMALEAPPAVAATAPAAPRAPAPEPEPADEEAVVENAEDEEPSASPPSLEAEEEDPKTIAALDPGLRKVLNKFPGRIRRVEES